jgi:hypothetical protein
MLRRSSAADSLNDLTTIDEGKVVTLPLHGTGHGKFISATARGHLSGLNSAVKTTRRHESAQGHYPVATVQPAPRMKNDFQHLKPGGRW